MSGFINAEGLFNGERLRRCSNLAQLHFPRLFLLSDGFGRIELNYAKILRAYATFNPLPSEIELQSWIQEYVSNFLLFVWMVDGQLWGQWDAKTEYLPRYKTAIDRRSPIPPENEVTAWKSRYRTQCKAFPKYFGNLRKVAEDFAQSSVVLSCVEERRENLMPRSLALTKPLDEWVELLYARHPKKKDKGLVGMALLSVLEKATDPEALIVEIDRRHDLWTKTNEWTERNARFVPSLAQWIEDHGWTQRPDTELPPPKRWVEED